MKVFIQSKSGSFNAIQEFEGIGTLRGVLDRLRYIGGYHSEHRDKEVFVPFEEIEFIRKVSAND